MKDPARSMMKDPTFLDPTFNADDAAADALVSKLTAEALETFDAVVIVGARVVDGQVCIFTESQGKDETARQSLPAVVKTLVKIAAMLCGHASGDEPLPHDPPVPS